MPTQSESQTASDPAATLGQRTSQSPAAARAMSYIHTGAGRGQWRADRKLSGGGHAKPRSRAGRLRRAARVPECARTATPGADPGTAEAGRCQRAISRGEGCLIADTPACVGPVPRWRPRARAVLRAGGTLRDGDNMAAGRAREFLDLLSNPSPRREGAWSMPIATSARSPWAISMVVLRGFVVRQFSEPWDNINVVSARSC